MMIPEALTADIRRININEGGRQPVETPFPDQETIAQFESHFYVRLPEDYLTMLRVASGGCPEINTFHYFDGRGASAVNDFFSLTQNKTDYSSLWMNTEWLRCGLLEDGLDASVVAIGVNGGGDFILLNMNVT